MKIRIHPKNRGVSEIIGAILVFGLVVISLALFQTTAVPAANEEVEFDHNQRVQTELLGLDAELSDAAATGNGGTAIVTVGTDYPTRFLFRNPPPVAGGLSTAESGFTIENAVAVGDAETDDYWDGSTARAYDSREVVYRVDYNVYDRAPTTVLAHGVVYDRFPDGTTRRIDAGGFIDGRDIELAALDGRRDESRVGALSVPVNAQSAPTETVRVRDDPAVANDNVRLTVRTDASAAAWESFLADELVSEGGHVETVLGPDEPGVDQGTVAVVLEEGVTYELRLARLSVGSPPHTPTPAYLTADGEPDRSVLVGRPTDLAVEVRDQYNGPVPGTDVTFSIDDGDGTRTETVTTDDDGEATLSYTPSSSGAADIVATVDGGTGSEGDPLSARFDLRVSAGGGGGGGGEQGPESINRRDRGIYYTSAEVVGRDSFVVDFESVDGSTYTIREARVSFISYEPQGRNPITGVEALRVEGNPDNIIANDGSLEVTGDFRALDPAVDVDGSGPTTLVFDFDGEFGAGASRQEFFVASMLVEGPDGEQYQTFFIGKRPDSGSSTGGNN